MGSQPTQEESVPKKTVNLRSTPIQTTVKKFVRYIRITQRLLVNMKIHHSSPSVRSGKGLRRKRKPVGIQGVLDLDVASVSKNIYKTTKVKRQMNQARLVKQYVEFVSL